jgi:tetratricopeptide (TPR) repeat protein
MPPTHICIVARLMTTARRALIVASLVLVVSGCEQLDGRSRNRKGNQAFREQHFVTAVAQYQKALTEVDEPTVHYNLGLAYSKVFKPGAEGDVLIDQIGTPACQVIPKVKTVNKQVCIKPDDHTFNSCDDKNVCASSFTCEKVDLCALDNTELANDAADNFAAWLKANPKDSETRALMTQVWMDSSQYKKALDFWGDLDKAKPNDAEIMGNLAGINLKANDWRKSIEWYLKVAAISSDPAAKVNAYSFIGNVAWAKLNSRTLTRDDSVEIADRGIGALQHVVELQPDNPKPLGLMASISNFRGQAQGPSWASATDRAVAQDLQAQSRVLREKAKAAAGQAPAAPGAPGAANTPNPAPHGTTGG